MYVAYCGYGGVIVCNFVYCDKSLGNQIVFYKQSCIQYAVKFLNAVAVPITCNHLKIDIINPGFHPATPLPCPSSHIKMSMCTYAGFHTSKLDYPLLMSQAAHCFPRHQTWAGYTTHTDVHNIYT